MKRLTCFVPLACAAALVACASPPSPAPTPTATAVAPSQTAAAPVAIAPAAAGSVAAAPAATAKVAVTSAPTGQAVAAQTGGGQLDAVEIYGYRRSIVDGKQLYCKTEQFTGSRVHREELCYTQAQLEAKQKNAEDYIHQLQQNSATNLHSYAGGTSAAP